MFHEVLLEKDYLQNGHDIFLNRVNDGVNFMHAHEFIEFSYIEKGRGIHYIGGNQETLESGDIYIINANVPHEQVLEEGYTILLYNCIFQPNILDDSLTNVSDFLNVAYNYLFHSFQIPSTSKGYIKLSSKKMYQIGELFKEMYSEFANKNDGYSQIIQSDLKKLLIYMFRLYREDMEQVHNSRLYKQMVVQNVIEYLNKNFDKDIKCDILAEHVYLSTSYLSRIFKETTGKTIISYLQEIRVNYACNLLKTTNLPVYEIMSKCGYMDIKYFYDIFHKKTGKTPGNYRKD